MRLYSGWGGPEDTNERFRYLLDQGQTGLSVALDLPTQMGSTPTTRWPRAEVGKVGVAIDSLADMEAIFDGIPLDRVSTSFTINATAPILLAMYQVVGEQPGVDPAALRGTVQNDILKEFLARKTYIFPPGPSLRLVADVIEYSSLEPSKFNPISVCGYHMRQAGCDAVRRSRSRSPTPRHTSGRHRPRAAGRLVRTAVLVQHLTMRDFFEEVAKHRAARRLWARISANGSGRRIRARGRSGSSRRRRNHADRRRAAEQRRPDDLQTLAVVLPARRRWTPFLGRGPRLPSEEAALVALRTQQIVAHESGAARTVDPLGGSYFLESLTDELERGRHLLESRARRRVAEIEDGSLERAIADAAYRQHHAIAPETASSWDENQFQNENADEQDIELLFVPSASPGPPVARLERLHAEPSEAMETALAKVRRTSEGTEHRAGDPRSRAGPGHGRRDLNGTRGRLRLPPAIHGHVSDAILGSAKLDHVGIAAESAELPLADLLGGEVSHVKRMPSGVAVGRFGPELALELVVPGGTETPIDRFLERRGPGLHHIALRVDEPLDGLLPRLRAEGIDIVGEIEPSSDGRPSLFLHPSSTGGVLVELVEGERPA